MGNYKSKRDLLYMKPQYFFKYVREHFQLRHLVTPEIMNIQTISETIQNMNGLSYDLVGLERWYLLEKKLPVYCYRLKLDQSPYLTYYFANSEQVPSSVGLGVLMEKDNTVRRAGGFIIQMMPFATEETISQIEENLKQVTSVTALLDQGKSPEELLTILLGNVGLEITDTIDTQFYCNCSKERVEQAVVSVGRKEIQEMINEGETIEVKCQFCNTAYHYTIEDLKRIIQRSR